MARGDLPADGELQLGPVRLPPGRRIVPWEEPGPPVAWVTHGPVPQPGPVWSALSGLHAETGLVPVLLAADEAEHDFFFALPGELAGIDRVDPAQLLAQRWADWMAVDEDDDEDEDEWPPGTAPDGAHPFPGLAPASGSRLIDAERDRALDALPAAHVGLVPAARPADVPAVVGWTTFDDPSYPDDIRNAVWIGAVLCSWADRFGARLLRVGPGAEITLLVDRPPRTTDAAARIAAEHCAFCDECAGLGLRTVPQVAQAILDAPTWTFWWD